MRLGSSARPIGLPNVPLSAPLPAPRPRFPDACQPHRHGLHAHAAGDAGSADRAHRALLRRARQGRRGADRHRRLLAQRGRADGAWRARCSTAASSLREHRPVTDAVHAAGGRIALQILHAGRYARVDGRGGAVGRRLADQSQCAAAHERGRHRAHHRGLRRDGGAGPRGRLRRRRDHGLARATSSTSSPRRAPTTATTPGAAASRTACGWAVEIMAAVRERVGARLPRHLPRLLDRPGARAA